MISICKTFRFEAAHRLPMHEGLCQHLHGHSYKLEIKIMGNREDDQASPTLGMLMDFSDLKQLVEELVLDDLDHSLLNELNHLSNPTAENIVLHIVQMIVPALPNKVNLMRVRLWETGTSYAEWNNPDIQRL